MVSCTGVPPQAIPSVYCLQRITEDWTLIKTRRNQLSSNVVLDFSGQSRKRLPITIVCRMNTPLSRPCFVPVTEMRVVNDPVLPAVEVKLNQSDTFDVVPKSWNSVLKVYSSYDWLRTHVWRPKLETSCAVRTERICAFDLSKRVEFRNRLFRLGSALVGHDVRLCK